MGIIDRMVRLWRADIHGVMDQMEDKSLLLKQTLRDMEEALEHKAINLHKRRRSYRSAQQDYDKQTLEIEKLDGEIDAALRKNKDDIARFLIKRRQSLELIRVETAYQLKVIKTEIEEQEADLERQRNQFEEIRFRYRQYRRADAGRDRNSVAMGHLDQNFRQQTSEEEIELELLRRKEKLNQEVMQ